MVSLVKGRADKIVHAGVGDDKSFGRRALHILHGGEQNARVADEAASGLEQNFQTKRFEQRHHRLGVVVESDAFAAVFIRPLPPIGRTTLQSAAVDDTNPAADAEKLDAVERLQLLHDRHEFGQGFDEGFGFEDLRSDMRLDPADLQVRQLGRLRVDPEDAVDADAELVVALARRNVFVGLRIDIRIDAQSHRGLFARCAGHLVDEFQLRLGLDVERINTLLESVFDFLPRLTHPGEGAIMGASARLEHAEQLAARHNVEARPLAGQQFKHGEVGVCLHGEAHTVIQTGKRLIETPVVLADRLRAVNVERSAVFGRQAVQRHALAIQLAVAVGKLVHKPGGAGWSAGRWDQLFPRRALRM